MPKNERALPDGFMTVGKLAERMGVTVRTLQYYDREGLLSPTAESGGGRRLYTDKDMIQLHQILSGSAGCRRAGEDRGADGITHGH